MPDPYWNTQIRDWYFAGYQAPDDFVPIPVLLEGWGPFDLKDFDLFLMRHGIDSTLLDGADPGEVVIVGTDGWSAERLTTLLKARVGDRLRVFSQEMFLTYMKTGVDPFSAPPAVLEAFAEDHTAIANLRQQVGVPFDWHTATVGPPGTVPLPPIGSPSPGLLKVAGYEVGNSGVQSDASRRERLTAVYVADNLAADFEVSRIPRKGPALAAYLAEWATPKSEDRLRKMAETIATFCRNARNKQARQQRPGGWDLAIKHWETDLAWLLKTYLPRAPKPNWWPTTYV